MNFRNYSQQLGSLGCDVIILKNKENSSFVNICAEESYRGVMSVSFYNNERSRKDEDLDCLETIAELTLRILSHRDDSYQNNSEINILILSRKRKCASGKTRFGVYLSFLCEQLFLPPSLLPFFTKP